MSNNKRQFDVIIIGAGLAGLVAAFEFLQKGKKVVIIDAQPKSKLGGLARVAFGGMALVGTPQQKSRGINDSPELAYQDWCSFAEFDPSDHWPKAWAKYYVENSVSEVFEYVNRLNVKFLPAVNWVERGLYQPGNSVPRYHILWGASLRLVEQLSQAIKPFQGNQLEMIFESKAEQLLRQGEKVVGCQVRNQLEQVDEYYADCTVIACGGFTGNLDKVKSHWPADWGKAPDNLLNGSHPSNNGKLHDLVSAIGGEVTHLDKMWPYAAGIAHPKSEFDAHGLSLIPCKSALWLDHRGQRIGPEPLVTGFDTHQLCKQISQLQLPHSWQLLNWRIALKELAVSGCEHNQAIRDRKFLQLLKQVYLGNKTLVQRMLHESEDFLMADDIGNLALKMNQLTTNYPVEAKTLTHSLKQYDQIVSRGERFWNDEQIRRIVQIRNWPTEKLRTCYPKPILDGSPLIAIKLNLITRKSLGGIKTDLNCRVLTADEQAIDGLYAIGEAAGFGGGGASGKRSLEGTFLSGCILTARKLVKNI